MLATVNGGTSLASTCVEHTKFVQQVAGTNLYYGNRDAVASLDHFPYCGTAGKVRASTFLRLRDDYLSWIEAGPSQEVGDTFNFAHIWTEYRAYPASTQSMDWDNIGTLVTNHWYSFQISNVGGGQFTIGWADSNNPDTAVFSTIMGSPAMGRDVGEAESEAVRVGDGSATEDVTHQAQNMETQNRQFGTWGLWTNLQCDTSQNSLHNGWNAVKFSNSHWENEQSTTGLCA